MFYANDLIYVYLKSEDFYESDRFYIALEPLTLNVRSSKFSSLVPFGSVFHPNSDDAKLIFWDGTETWIEIPSFLRNSSNGIFLDFPLREDRLIDIDPTPTLYQELDASILTINETSTITATNIFLNKAIPE